MQAFVLLALALGFVSLGAAAVAARQLWLGTRRLRAVVDRTGTKLQPLLDDLQAEVAVSATEAEAVQERLTALQESRRRGGRPSRSGGEHEPGVGALP